MKRLRRTLFNLAAGISLFLLALTTVIWIRSYWAFDDWSYYWPYTRLKADDIEAREVMYGSSVLWGWGRIRFMQERTVSNPPGKLAQQDGLLIQRFAPKYPHSPSLQPFLEFYIDHYANYRPGYGTTEYWNVVAPLWSLVTVTTFLPILWAIRWRLARSHSRDGLCANCGYDLRATPERCPECGTVPESKAVTAK